MCGRPLKSAFARDRMLQRGGWNATFMTEGS
jgi:hypothetical protein